MEPVMKKTLLRWSSLVAIASVALTGCAGPPKSTGPTYTIAYEGPLSGAGSLLSASMQNGVRLAVEEANAKGDLSFTLGYLPLDDQGKRARAADAARKAITDPTVVAVVGPTLSSTTEASSALYAEAELATVTPTATAPQLTDPRNNFGSLLRAVPHDGAQGAGMATYYARRTGAQKVYLIDDGTVYGKNLADVAQTSLTSAAIDVIRVGVPRGTPDYTATARAVVASRTKALIYAGSYQDLAPLAKKLREAGYTGAGISGDGANDKSFVDLAGEAAENWFLTCPCVDATREKATQRFAAAYTKRFGTTPGAYAAESYDVTNMIIATLRKTVGKTDPKALRSTLLKNLASAEYTGLTKVYAFDEKGEFRGSGVSLYQVKNGVITYQGNIDRLADR
ncbi:branched-chain amino acid ABC transporter substrate-binding protein [Streptomyces zaomyceticus]|uniref:branched-chain amino acid ABC transporter substrate-binding protein n=1 Tax=Streptomyces zaomyceticus TaxID=68286 RepID=UPI003675AC09